MKNVKNKKLDKNGKEFLTFPKKSGLYQNECGQVYMTLPNGKEYELHAWWYKEDGSNGTESECFIEEAKNSLDWYNEMQNAIEVDLVKTVILTEDLEGPDFWVKAGTCKLLKVLFPRDHHSIPLAIIIQDEKGDLQKIGGTYFQELCCWNEELGLM